MSWILFKRENKQLPLNTFQRVIHKADYSNRDYIDVANNIYNLDANQFYLDKDDGKKYLPPLDNTPFEQYETMNIKLLIGLMGTLSLNFGGTIRKFITDVFEQNIAFEFELPQKTTGEITRPYQYFFEGEQLLTNFQDVETINLFVRFKAYYVPNQEWIDFFKKQNANWYGYLNSTYIGKLVIDNVRLFGKRLNDSASTEVDILTDAVITSLTKRVMIGKIELKRQYYDDIVDECTTNLIGGVK